MSIKSAELSDTISFREKCAVSRRLLKEVHRMSPSFIPFTVLRHFLGLLGGYTGIYVSTMVLNELQQDTGIRELIIKSAVLLGVAYILQLVNMWLEKRAEAIKNHTFDQVQAACAVKNMEIDYPELDSPYMRELRNRLESDNNWGNSIYGAFMYIEFLLYQIFNALFGAAMLAPILPVIINGSGWLGYAFLLVLLFMIVLNVFGESYYNKRILFWQEKEPERSEDINLLWDYVVNDGIARDILKDIKLYQARGLLYEYLVEHGKKFEEECMEKIMRAIGKRYTLGAVFGSGAKGVCYFFLTLMAAANGVAVGMLVRYVACFERITSSVQAILRDVQSFLLTARRQSSTFEYLDLKGSLYRGKLPVEKRSDNEYEVEFRNVSFRYPESDEYALKNFSLKLRIGEKMAVVGKNGSGKTTMIKLLCRLYDPTEGEILLNGVDIRKFDYREYMKLFSIVFQDFALFDFSIAKNVAAEEEYIPEQVEECLRRAGFGERLSELERGIETPVGTGFEDEGIFMSGGERQKIAIARALYKGSPFILLDEPTAALDPIAEFEIYSAFNEMVGNKTAIYISHRLSSCRFCNDIVVFDGGQIVQRGSHEELIQKEDGMYYSLWNAQAQYYEKHESNARTRA